MGKESIEEGQLSNPLLIVNDSGGHSGAVDSNHDDDHGGDYNDWSSSATTMVVLSTLVAVSGSYVFGSAVSKSVCIDQIQILVVVFSEIFLAV